MFSTTLTMAPIHTCGFTGRDKTNRPAKAAAFKLLWRIAYDLILRALADSVSE